LPWLGVLAAWLVVVDPVQIFYATEARPYAAVQLLAVVHVGLLAELLVRQRWTSHLLFVAAGALLFHLHYTAAFLLVAETTAVGFAAAMDRRWPSKALFRDFLAIAALCLPAIPHLLTVFARRANWELFVPQPTLAALVTLLPWTWTALVVLVGQASRLSGVAVEKASRLSFSQSSDDAPDHGDRFALLLALCWLLVPLLLAWTLARTDLARLFFLRYLMVSAPAAIVLAVLAVRMIPWSGVRVGGGLVLALAALWTPVIPQFLADGRLIADRRADWRSAIAHFNEQPDRRRYPVLVASQLIESEALRGSTDPALAAYCLSPVHSLYPIDADPAITFALPRSSPGQLAAPVRDLVASRGGAWLIMGGGADAADAAARDVMRCIQSGQSQVPRGAENWSVIPHGSFGTVHVLQLRAQP
jgi:hypothetical protein